MPYDSKLHIPPVNYHLVAAQQEPSTHEKSLTFNVKCLNIFWQNVTPIPEKMTRQKAQEDYEEKPEKREQRGVKLQPWDSRQERNLRHPGPPFRVVHDGLMEEIR